MTIKKWTREEQAKLGSKSKDYLRVPYSRIAEACGLSLNAVYKAKREGNFDPQSLSSISLYITSKIIAKIGAK